ncbi:MAG: hypothetical protein H6624_16255 [Bdellovibrionaceae bacterium]|nr:hypothetical protein [Bdellovibrionales bacterium]MCB9085901.1 hypothetical protein [Pseudobdellovibrionaceae bacterium]
MKPVLVFILLGFVLTWSAQAYNRYKPKKYKVSAAQTEKIKVKVWQKKVYPGLIGGVCEQEGYFQTCFKVVVRECEKEAKEQLSICRANMRMPKTFRSDHEAVYWSQKVGECLGGRLEKKWSTRKSDKSQCRQVGAWL